MQGFMRVGAMCGAMLAMGLSGCTREVAPEIPAAQVEEWNAEAVKQFPDLTIEIRADQNVDNFGGGSNSVYMVILFDDFADLTASESALAAFEEQIKTDAGIDFIGVEAASSDDEGDAAAIQADAQETFTDVAKADATISYPRIDGSWQASVDVNFFVESSASIDPEWLAAHADAAEELALRHGGQLTTVSLIDASELDRIAENPNLRPNRMLPSTVDSLTQAADDDCLRAGDWAFDISSSFIDVYPADAPGGACA